MALSPLDIIITCCICQQSISSLYVSPQHVDGLRQGHGHGNSKITKLWLTECAHLTCTKHLPGGGVPFHPATRQPQAPCPLCSREKGDNTNKTLFAVNGVAEGEYDHNIPKAYFQTPPARLGGDDPDLEALRFQYLSLLRFGSMRQKRVKYLERQLQTWENRKPLLVHCMNGFSSLQRELEDTRKRLEEMGQDVSSIAATLELTGSNPAENPSKVAMQFFDAIPPLTKTNTRKSNTRGSSQLAQASAAQLEEMNNQIVVEADPGSILSTNQGPSKRGTDFSPGKTRRIESTIGDIFKQWSAHGSHRSTTLKSRDAMPPPPRPFQVFATLKPTSNADYEETTRSLAPSLLASSINSQSLDFSSRMPSSYGCSHAPAVSNINTQTYQPAIHRSSSAATTKDYHFPPQTSAYEMSPKLQNLRPSVGQQAYSTFQQDQNDKTRFSQPSTTEIQPNSQKLWSSLNTHPNMQQLANPRVSETQASLTTISKAGNMGFPTYYNIDSDIHDDEHQFTDFSTEAASGSLFDLIKSQRVNGFHSKDAPINDGELDQYISNASDQTITPTPTANRVSLLPRTSSVSGTPRFRTSVSGNSRTSRSGKRVPLMTLNAPRLHRKPVGNASINSHYGTSPYFSHPSLTSPAQNSNQSLVPQWPLSQAGQFMGVCNKLEKGFQAVCNQSTNQSRGKRPFFQPGLPGHGAQSGDLRFAANVLRA